MSALSACILLVEDEPSQRAVLSYNLMREGYQVTEASDGEEAMLYVEEAEFDLILLDWMLPALSGIEICRRLKRHKRTKDVPVIMLSARAEDVDKVRGLDTGADDYLAKPYSLPELLARIRSHLRRFRAAAAGETVSVGDIALDPLSHRVQRAGADITLGPTEFRLLTTLMERPGRVWTRDQLLDRVWQSSPDTETRTVDVHIGRLRKALKRTGAPDPIRTVRGSGYSIG
jgi:two-component system, OmpR family, phosphate regulon response regulator PhoB